MSKRLNKATAKLEASKTRQRKQHKMNKLANNDDVSNISSTVVDVEEVYSIQATPLSESNQ